MIGWMMTYALHRWQGLVAMLALILVRSAFEVLKPWPMKVLVDYALYGKPRPAAVAKWISHLPGSGTREELITWCIAGTIILFLGGWLLALAVALVNISFGQRMVYDLAADVFAYLQRLSLRFHARKPIGDSIRRVTADCGCISVIVKDALLPVLSSAFTLVAMFWIMWRMDRGLTLLSLVVLPYLIWVFRTFLEPMETASYRQQEVEGEIYNEVERTLAAIPVVQAFGREEDADARFKQTTDQALEAALKTTAVQFWFKVLIGLSTAVGTALILWIGGKRVIDGRLSVGDILIFLSYLASLYSPLESIMYTSSTIQGAAGSARRVLEILDTEHDVKDRPGAPPLAAIKGHVKLENVSFGYETGRPVLQNITLDVPAGKTLAIVGPTGSGKSTLVSLVPRFFDPWQGRVLIDGQDLRDVQLPSARRQISLVLQEPFLFPLTIAQNIAYGRPDATPEQIEAAAVAANAHEFIKKLPEGYQTKVGERGATLSGGQRQRLSIARALLKDAPILILDEPTSALDAETEMMLLEALHRLMAGRTTFIIAHRLSTIRNADRIILIDQGRIAEQGTHAELMIAGALYARMYGIQFAPEPAKLASLEELLAAAVTAAGGTA
jgi:ATP-binding cassette subfamily B protein/subfamily B ATP-binding cassette protein MsbA